MKLNKRQLNEKNHHDLWAQSINLTAGIFQYKKSFESPTAIENQYVLSLIKNLKNKKILDLGCGLGDASLYFAKNGAKVTAIDISSKMVELVKKTSRGEKLSSLLKTYVMPAENLNFRANGFDYVYGNSILHHVNLNKTAREIKRVLIKEGYGFFIEPLSYNFIINIYRKIANKVRTKYEKPLSFKDINIFCQRFTKSFHKEFHFFTLLVFIWFFIGERIHPNKERYWKKIIIEGDKYKNIFNILYAADKLILEYLPFLRRFCWTTVIVVQK